MSTKSVLPPTMSIKRVKSYSRVSRTFIDAPSLSSTTTKKRARESDDENDETRVVKRAKTFKATFASTKKPLAIKTREQGTAGARKPLRQLVLAISTKPSLISCPKCALSYTRGAEEDEALHKSHCTRVMQGSEWTKEDDKEALKLGAIAVGNIQLKNGRGRIICIKAGISGRLGTKLDMVMETVNHALSSPPLTTEALATSKFYLFLLREKSKEKIVGCVIAQRIETALRVVTSTSNEADGNLLFVDRGVFCDPNPLPTSLGISRVFVSNSHRRQGIAQHLLNAAIKTFVHGHTFDVKKGDVAFSQPTSDGHRLMTSWGEGCVRVFEE